MEWIGETWRAWSPPTQAAAFVAGAALILWVAVLLGRFLRVRAAINRIPGPPTTPGLGHLLAISHLRDDHFVGFHLGDEAHRKLQEEFFKDNVLYRWSQAYKPIFRVWLGEFVPLVIVNDPAVAADVLGPAGPRTKARLYRFIRPWLKDGLLTSTGKKWQTRRRLLTPSFHFKILEEYFEVFRAQTTVLISKIDAHAASGKPFHIYPLITHAALDMITACATGAAVGAQRTDGNSAYVRAVYTMLESTFERVIKPWLWPDIIFWYCSRPGRAAGRSLRTLKQHTRDVISRRRAELHAFADADADGAASQARARSQSQPTGCSSFLDVLLTAKDEDGRPLPDEAVEEEVDTLIFEGHDTTSSSITWALYMLACHPSAQERVQRELADVLGDKAMPDYADVKQLPFLDAVILESLRLFSSVPFIGRTVEKPISVGGYTIPAGVEIAVPPLGVHHNESVWAESWVFDPERHLRKAAPAGEAAAAGHVSPRARATSTGDARRPRAASGGAKARKTEAYKMMAFSAGPRGCIGRNFAQLEERVVLAALLQRYNVSVVRDQQVIMSLDLIAKPRDGKLLLQFERR